MTSVLRQQEASVLIIPNGFLILYQLSAKSTHLRSDIAAPTGPPHLKTTADTGDSRHFCNATQHKTTHDNICTPINGTCSTDHDHCEKT